MSQVQQNHPWLLSYLLKKHMIYKLCVSETAIYSLKEKQTKKPLKTTTRKKKATNTLITKCSFQVSCREALVPHDGLVHLASMTAKSSQGPFLKD